MSGGDSHSPDTGPSDPTFDPSGGEPTWVGDEEPVAEVVAERYAVQRELGRGAIGVVERVFDAHLERTVARKRLLDDRPASRARFIREARTTASLAHPGIPPVFDLGVDTDIPYYTMQEIVGRPWKELIQEAGDLEARLAQLDILLAVARAVAHAHERDLVHRDLKLDNVMVGPLGDVFVVDWGLCVPVGHEGPPSGTPQYMSPEQARGETTTRAFDVWALGALLFRLLTARAPYGGPSGSAVLEQARTGQIRDLIAEVPEAPAELVDMVRKATSIDPEARYEDAGAFAADLRAFLQGNWVMAHEYSVRELVEKLFARHKRRLAIGGTLGAVVLVGLLGGGWVVLDQRDRARAAVAERQKQLADALEDRAATARADRWEPAAEIAAARALQIDPDHPRAWGVLARHGFTVHPTLAWSTALPCPAVAADDGRLLLDCPHAFSLAHLTADGTLGTPKPLRLPTLGPGDESVQHAMSDHLLARWGGAGRRALLDLSTGEHVPLPDNASVSSRGVLDGEAGFVLRGPGALSWLPTHAPQQAVRLGPSPVAQNSLVDPYGILLSNADDGAFRCTGRPLTCTRILDLTGIAHLAGGEGWLAADAVGAGIHILRPPASEPEDLHVVLPTDAGAYLQLQVVDGFLAALRTEGDVDLWTLDGQPVARLPTSELQPTHLGRLDGRLLVLGERVDAWDLGSVGHTQRPSLAGALAHREGVHVSAEDGRLVLLTDPLVAGPGFEGIVKSVDVDDGGVVWAVEAMGPIVRWDPATDRVDRQRIPASVRRVVTVPEGGVLAMDYAKQIHRIHDDGRIVATSGRCWGDMARSSDRTVVVCGHHNRLLRLDPSTGEEVEELTRHERALWALAVSPGGERVVYATDGHELVELDLASGATRTVGPHHDSFVADIAFSPDDRWLATASWDQRIHVYDAATLRLAAVLEGHEGRVVALDFATPTDLASIGWDQVLWRWDLSALDQRPEAHLHRVVGELGGRVGPSER